MGSATLGLVLRPLEAAEQSPKILNPFCQGVALG